MDTLYFRPVPYTELVRYNKYVIKCWSSLIPKGEPYSIELPNKLVVIFKGYRYKKNLAIFSICSYTYVHPDFNKDNIVPTELRIAITNLRQHSHAVIYEMVPTAHHNLMVKIIQEKAIPDFHYPFNLNAIEEIPTSGCVLEMSSELCYVRDISY